MNERPTLAKDALRALPYALILAIGLGAVVSAGAHLSNAFPSEQAPYGWPGPADLENGVAMVRSDIIIATTLPALLLGARALAHHDPAHLPRRGLLRIYGLHASIIAASIGLATALAAWGSAKHPTDALVAFWTAHTILALSFYSIGLLWSSRLREQATAAAAATWLAFIGLHEAVTRTILFRTEGYQNLASGSFPDWFWIAQATSPLSTYTGILILWRNGFRDAMEKAVLTDATLPTWLTPGLFILLAILLWMLIPLAISTLAWRTNAGTREPANVDDMVQVTGHLRAPRRNG